MKKYKFIFLLLIVAFTGSCDNELDLKPESILTYNGFWDTEEAARAAHVGLYASFRGYHFTLWGLGEVRSDIWGGPTVESPSSLDLINQNISSTNVPYANWANFYVLIHRINDFLYNIENVGFIEETEKQHMIGQVYGMRAYVYYTMLKTWGGVPITTEPLLNVNPGELARKRASKEEVMSLIKSDIENSLTAFGENNSFWNGKKTYWSKAATLTLKGDTYIWSGNLLGGGTTDFTEAKIALQEVQDMGFSLVEDYDALWGEENENNQEFIFKFDYTQDQAGNFYSGQFTGRSTEINALYDKDGNSMADFITNGGNRYGPTSEILNELEDPLDDRGNATFITLFDADGNYVTSVLNKFLGSTEAW
ncbi:RagB/SusD family nutrient uptake outer membrane protein [Antarcticibacterium sp. 1MA-6-2]|uniref:RagB/SusD family nutrient uptake outer membrane protein n=1 Tax=Antarcticibacterium sp. 1MA-6-2 TaxID=2908210 RepID=UPI001F272DA4|nr:RagB/SusD family nutrient uptake outer membrane protein [Antarcticibacterium sp. 1MA-6-2]UJH92644.1 RagB/SusD family nutrient uptake outer membrane protein [Antarcticibacterium sp. 1MA-6-2]